MAHPGRARLLVCLLLCAAHPARAATLSATWLGGTGNWNESARWSSTVVPHNDGTDSFDAAIDGGNATASEVTLDTEELIGSLRVDAGDALVVSPSGRLTLEGAELMNAGTIRLGGIDGAFPSSLVVNASDTALSGGGTVQLEGGGISGLVGGQSLTNADNRIEGWGEIQVQGFRAFVNQGVIEANVAGKSLLVVGGANEGTVRAVGGASAAFPTAGQGFLNTGAVETSGSGSSFRQADTTVSLGGSYTAADHSSMNLAGALEGTRLTTDATSHITFAGGQHTSLKDVTLEGQFDGNEILVTGTIVNRGDFAGALDPLGSTRIQNEGHVRLLYGAGRQPEDVLSFGGGGTVELATGSSPLGLGMSFRNLDNEMSGFGSFDHLLENGGVIEASGGSLVVRPSQVQHTGVFAAAPGGVLEMDAMVRGSGGWRADGGRIHVTGDVETTGDVEVLHGGSLVVETQMSAGDLLVDRTSSLDVRGVLRVAGDLDFDGPGNGRWSFATGSFFETNGGVAAAVGDWQDWQSLEAAGRDLGLIAAGFTSGNFYLPRLIIGPDGHMFLKDGRDNENRVGSDEEVLYVDTLVFSDSLGQLNLNGITLYYNHLVGLPSQIIDVRVTVPEAGVTALLAAAVGVLALVRLPRRRESAPADS